MKIQLLLLYCLVQYILMVNGLDSRCITKEGYFSNPLNCNEFFYCDNWQVVVKKCPPGLHFNPHYSVCDDPLTADCPKVCKEANGHFPNSHDCTQYYQCANEVASLRDCPDGYHFNKKISVCDFPEDANCV